MAAREPGLVVTLPYKGGRLAYSVIVPASLDAVRGKGVAQLLSEVRPATVALAMPRFTACSSMDLTETLAQAGMPKVFSKAAEFDGITDDLPLHIASVRHKTFAQVDEEGAEAAAASGADSDAATAPMVREVTVDRPFLFVITDTATGAPLFLGRIGDPTADKR